MAMVIVIGDGDGDGLQDSGSGKSHCFIILNWTSHLNQSVTDQLEQLTIVFVIKCIYKVRENLRAALESDRAMVSEKGKGKEKN